MVKMFHPRNNVIHEGDTMGYSLPRYHLESRDLLRMLMSRTGTGHRITVRELASQAGVAHGTISNLLTGTYEDLPGEAAHRVAAAIGVDVLVLFTPTGRAVPAIELLEAAS